MAPPVELFDPLKAREALQEPQESRKPAKAPSPRRKRKAAVRAPERPQAGVPVDPNAPTPFDPAEVPENPDEAWIKADFRVFLTLLWRFLLGCNPNAIQLDMAWWLQHGPERSVIMAFRGFAKSWITGAYALWRLYCDPQQKILVVSGSLTRAVATTNWCLQLILTWPLLAGLQPKRDQRQSSKAFDVGPAVPDQSPSFHALGIGGQIVGFRGDCIIPDDVETQQNSLTVHMREKNAEAVKEFDSVLKPGGVIKFLGTPHDADSLYTSQLAKRGYTLRIWPALYPTEEQRKGYGDKLAPWIEERLAKEPTLVGSPTMPERFPMADLEKRRTSLGSSEFALQFMLDTSLSDRNKYPLKCKDLMVMTLDPRRGPEALSWSNDPKDRVSALPLLGFEGDHYYAPVVAPGTPYAPWSRVVGSVDSSGRGDDETSLAILAELHGIVFLLYVWAAKAGFEPETLGHIAQACVRFRVNKLRIEANFGDGMFATLLRPILEKAWRKHNDQMRKAGRPAEEGGTELEEVKATGQMSKEKRILSIMEPVTQQHRLVVNQEVLEWDYESLKEIQGEDTRHRYSLAYQYTHLTRERDCLGHDDRLDSLTLGIADFADILGVDPQGMAVRAREDRDWDEYEKLFGDLEDDEYGIPSQVRPGGHKPESMKPAKR